MNEISACRVTTHGSRELELALNYPLLPERRTVRYVLDAYLFNPPQLQITEATYGVHRFLGDLKSSTRYTTPEIALERMLDPDCEQSPLHRIRKKLASAGTAPGSLDTDAILYEIRTLANIYHGQMRAYRRAIREKLFGGASREEVENRIAAREAIVARFLENFRHLHEEFDIDRVPEWLRQSLRWADEYISLVTEKQRFKVAEDFSARHGTIAPPAFAGALAEEADYRAARDYPTRVDPRDPVCNELFLYRSGVLKKWAEGCMYMTRAPSPVAHHLLHVFFALAAAAAMAFALVVGMAANSLFALYSLPWALLVIAAYAFKDRIKEGLRAITLAHLPNLLADRIEEVIDPASGEKTGSSRARVRFLSPPQLPEEVRRLRSAKSNSLHPLLRAEDVIHFRKEVRFDQRHLTQHHTRLEAITEILRLDLHAWRGHMDDPTNILRYMEEGELRQLEARRTYHINVIVSVTEHGKQEPPARFFHRVIMTREGILRIEHVG